MFKHLMLVGSLAALSAVPTSASAAAVLEGDTITCSTNTFAFSRCNGAQSATATVAFGEAESEFSIFATPDFDPLLTVDFENGIFRISSFGDRTISSTVLTFALGTGRRFDSFGAGIGLLANRASILSGGILQLNLAGVAFTDGAVSEFSVSAVPEPGTWMLMIFGLGAVGFAMRRRQTSSVRFQFA